MMPDKLFIVDPSKFSDKEVKDPTYCAFESQDGSIEGIEYIRKDALLEKLRKAAESYKKRSDEGELVWQNMCGINEAIGILNKM